VDAFDCGVWCDWVGNSSRFLHHAIVHSNPDSIPQAIPALQLQVLPDPAGPDSVYILGVEGDFERPALEAAGAEQEV
jgi:hypothetical protein